MPNKRSMPDFINGVIKPETYFRWLSRKTAALVKRDRKRGHECTASEYRDMIYKAVDRSKGKDEYTNEELDWTLVSTYDNTASKLGRHSYKADFALLPTVDHEEAGSKTASFRICGWRTNDSKHDLSLQSFLELCEKTLKFAGYKVEKPSP